MDLSVEDTIYNSRPYWGRLTNNGGRSFLDEKKSELIFNAQRPATSDVDYTPPIYNSQVNVITRERDEWKTEIRSKMLNALRTNDNSQMALVSRAIWAQLFLDPGAYNLYRECGYPEAISPLMYRAMYDREGIATKVVNVWPKESWKLKPTISDDPDPRKDTKFKTAFQDLNRKHKLIPFMQRVDALSGVGSYGLLFLGINDGLPTDQPAAGYEEDGTRSKKVPKQELLYMRAFDESQVRVGRWVTDQTNPRYAQPEVYLIRFLDYTTVPMGQTVTDVVTHLVHWTRVIHIADNRKSSEIFGVPRMQQVYNRLLDLRKVYGGSAEMSWKAGYPGLSIETQPDVVNPEIDEDMLRSEIERYQSGLQRVLLTEGLTVKTLQGTVFDPTAIINCHLRFITTTLDVPWRVFMGSEQGELASSQDKQTWNERLDDRQTSYIVPDIVRPTNDRLIGLGCLPEPLNDEYEAKWPDLNTPTDQDKASIGLSSAQAIAAWQSGGCGTSIPLFYFLTIFMGVPEELAEEICEAAAEAQEEQQEQEMEQVQQHEMDLEHSGDYLDQQQYADDSEGSGNAGGAPGTPAQPTGNVGTSHSYCSTQVNLDGLLKVWALGIGYAIPDSALAADGREDEPHITVRYGLLGNDEYYTQQLPEVIHTLLLGESNFIEVEFGALSYFPANESQTQRGGAQYDVLKVEIVSPDLLRLNQKLGELPNETTFPNYHPHMTIAYLKPGEGHKYVGLENPLYEIKTVFQGIMFSDTNHNKTWIPVGAGVSDDDDLTSNVWSDKARAAALEARRAGMQEQQEKMQSHGVTHEGAVMREGFTPVKRDIDTGDFYHHTGSKLSEDVVARIKKLGIAPGYHGVQISNDPKSELQATYIDSKGRQQYKYSAEHSDGAKAEKFARVRKMVQKLPKLRESIVKGLASKDPNVREAAATLHLIDKTGFRLGSDKDTKAEVQAFGASTLKPEHVAKVEGNAITFKFIGKKGVPIEQTVSDPTLAKIVKERLGRDGHLFNTNDYKVRQFLKKAVGPAFEVKDLRTVVATDQALNAIKSLPPPTNDKEFKQSRNRVGDFVAQKLGNTRSVSLKHYIPEEVFSQWKHAS